MNLLERIELQSAARKLQGRKVIQGLNISIENRKGSVRKGVDRDGHEWSNKMGFSYGYIRRTEGTDGDHVDCYVGPNEDSDKVFVIHQNHPDTGKFDEDKVMIGFNSSKEAKAAYLAQYDKPGFFGSMDEMTMDEFKKEVLATKDNPGQITANVTGPGGGSGSWALFIDSHPKAHPPSLKKPEHVPAGNDPFEDDDRFLDMTNRYAQKTKEFREAIMRKRARPVHVETTQVRTTQNTLASPYWTLFGKP